MKLLLWICLAAILVGCDSTDINYPKSYTLSHIEHAPEGLFVLTSISDYTPIDVQTGSYGMYREETKALVEEFIVVAFDVREVELLSDDMVRIHWFTEDEEIDTIVTYTMEDKEIIIEALAGSNLLVYNSEDDQFEVCAITQIALPGPNVFNPGQEYNNFDVSECLPNYNPEDYVEDALVDFQYAIGDTIGVLITKFIYKEDN